MRRVGTPARGRGLRRKNFEQSPKRTTSASSWSRLRFCERVTAASGLSPATSVSVCSETLSGFVTTS